jgi:hypothetical protein
VGLKSLKSLNLTNVYPNNKNNNNNKKKNNKVKSKPLELRSRVKIKFKFLIPGINWQAPSFNLRYIWFRPNHWHGCPRNHMKTFLNIDGLHSMYIIFNINKGSLFYSHCAGMGQPATTLGSTPEGRVGGGWAARLGGKGGWGVSEGTRRRSTSTTNSPQCSQLTLEKAVWS